VTSEFPLDYKEWHGGRICRHRPDNTSPMPSEPPWAFRVMFCSGIGDLPGAGSLLVNAPDQPGSQITSFVAFSTLFLTEDPWKPGHQPYRLGTASPIGKRNMNRAGVDIKTFLGLLFSGELTCKVKSFRHPGPPRHGGCGTDAGGLWGPKLDERPQGFFVGTHHATFSVDTTTGGGRYAIDQLGAGLADRLGAMIPTAHRHPTSWLWAKASP